MNKIELIKPDDWHVHFREGEILKKIVPLTSNLYNRAVVMPNISSPIISSQQAKLYKKEILKYSKNNKFFEPLITFYLTENLILSELILAHNNKDVFAVKLYPAGATTNSSQGINNISSKYHFFEEMCRYQIPLLIHGEINEKSVDVFDREKVFIENELIPIIKRFPELKITLEHITTKFAVDFINEATDNIKASITPHHLILNRTDMLEHKIKPHYYCLPILKREDDRKALLQAAFNINKKFFLGTDSAPHTVDQKEMECGCAGIFNTVHSVEILTQIFDDNSKLDKLENFLSINGCLHYNLPVNKTTIKLEKSVSPLIFDEYLHIKNKKIKIFKPNFDIFWEIKNDY